MCWRTKKVKSDRKNNSKDPEAVVTSAEAANPVVDQNQSANVKPDKITRFREALLKSQDDQKTIAVGTLAQVVYEPTQEDKKFFEAPGAPSAPPNTPKTMKTSSTKNANQPVATNSKIHAAVSKKPIEVTATERPTEVTATEELHPAANEPKTTKTAGTQIESKSKTKDKSKKVKQVVLAKEPVADKVAFDAIKKAPNTKRVDKMTKSPATGTGLSVDTGGAQISTGEAEEPEVFENVQLGSSTMRVLEQKLAPNSAATNAQSGQLSVVGRDIIIGFPDNISDENENNGEKLYHANAAVTASGMLSHLIDEGAVGATAGNEDRRATSGRPDSRMAKKSTGKRRDRDEDTLRDVPSVLPEKDYDEFLPPVAEKKAVPKRRKKRAKTEEEIVKTEEQEPSLHKPVHEKKSIKQEAKGGKQRSVMEEKTPPSESPEQTQH